jgi:hypothetical protein
VPTFGYVGQYGELRSGGRPFHQHQFVADGEGNGWAVTLLVVNGRAQLEAAMTAIATLSPKKRKMTSKKKERGSGQLYSFSLTLLLSDLRCQTQRTKANGILRQLHRNSTVAWQREAGPAGIRRFHLAVSKLCRSPLTDNHS